MSLFHEQISSDLQRLFAATGRRCYVIGSLDGGFPDLGHHLPGEMGGLWTSPVKLADGFWFGLSRWDPNGERAEEGVEQIAWMHGSACTSFTMKPGVVEREYLLHLGYAAIVGGQQIFVPDDEPGLLIDLSLHNVSQAAVHLTLSWLVRWDIQGAWWSHWPDRPDEAHFEEEWGGIVAWDSGRPEWSGAMLAGHAPHRHEIGTDLWGPEQTSSLLGAEGVKRGGILPNPEELLGAGISGRLDYDVTLRPGERVSLNFVLAGGRGGRDRAQQKATELLARRDALLREKETRQEALIATAPAIETPQPAMDRVFALQNLCMDMLTLELPGVARGAVAGLPNFAWFFGCDTYYSVSGLLVAGQAETAMANLRLLANYARRQGGRIPHEITPSGLLFNPGNTVETAQFVIAVERTFRWTSDRAFLEEMYEVCVEGVFSYLLGECDPGRTYLPEGPGMLELQSAERGRKLDVAAALHHALRSLAYMASSVGDQEMVARCDEVRARVREAIDRHFWAGDRREYVWRIEHDLSMSPGEPAQSYAMMEMGVLDGANEHDAALIGPLFEKVEGPEHTGPKGIFHPGMSDFVMPIGNAVLAQAEFQYGRADQGLWYLERVAELCDRAMPWAIPEFESTMHGSYDPCFLQLWSSAAYNWLAVQGWFRLLPDPDQGIVLVRPQLPSGWHEVHVKNLKLWGDSYDLSLHRVEGEIRFTVKSLSGHNHHPFRVDKDAGIPVEFV